MPSGAFCKGGGTSRRPFFSYVWPLAGEGYDMDRQISLKGSRGVSVPETLVASAILGLMAVVGMGTLERLCAQSSAQALNQTVRGLVGQAQCRAVAGRLYVGLAFESTADGAVGRIYEDGDGDGVTREDIQKGVDRPLTSRIPLRAGWAFLGVPEGVKKDPLGNPLAEPDPVRFGRGDILSFSPTGTSTPGSLYLRDAHGTECWAFRVAGIDGRVRTYRWWKGKWSEVK